jgi:hypothetical protein
MLSHCASMIVMVMIVVTIMTLSVSPSTARSLDQSSAASMVMNGCCYAKEGQQFRYHTTTIGHHEGPFIELDLQFDSATGM